MKKIFMVIMLCVFSGVNFYCEGSSKDDDSTSALGNPYGFKITSATLATGSSSCVAELVSTSVQVIEKNQRGALYAADVVYADYATWKTWCYSEGDGMVIPYSTHEYTDKTSVTSAVVSNQSIYGVAKSVIILANRYGVDYYTGLHCISTSSGEIYIPLTVEGTLVLTDGTKVVYTSVMKIPLTEELWAVLDSYLGKKTSECTAFSDVALVLSFETDSKYIKP